jgi:hypothetical protein
MKNTENRLFLVDIDTLCAFYNQGFNHGSNEGPFPVHGTFNEIHNLLDGKPLLHDGDEKTYPQVKQGIHYKVMDVTPEEMMKFRSEAVFTLKNNLETAPAPFIEKFSLVKEKVCTSCLSPHIVDKDCICTYQRNYPTIELEFKKCNCCGQVDYHPADTEFNNEQHENHK